MSHFLQLPWSNNQKHGGPYPLNGNTSISTEAMLAALDIDADTDAELAALLAEAAAAGRVLTEDVVVECQLTQFPAYGSTPVTKQQPQHSQPPSGAGNYGDEEAQVRNNHSLVGDKSQHGGAGDNWLAWMGGSTSVSNKPVVGQEEEEEENYLADLAEERSTGAAATRTSPSAAPPSDATDWDDEEQRLWKTPKPTPNKKKPLQSNKPVVYRTPLISAPRTGLVEDIVSTTATAAEDSRLQQQQDDDPVDAILAPRSPRTMLRVRPKSTEPTATATAPPILTTTTDRQHWMPDQLCKQCYACETPFTVFRRRHHCRLCGQVFCNACSANFVPSDAAAPPPPAASTSLDTTVSGGATTAAATSPAVVGGSKPTVRVCQMCYEHAKSGLYTPTATNTTTTNKPSSAADDHLSSPDKILLRTPPSPRLSGSGKRLPMYDPLFPAAATSSSVTTATNDHGEAAPSQPQPQSLHSDDVNDDRPNKNDNAATTKITTVDRSVRAQILEGHRHMGGVAASHLECLARELLRLRAPLLWKASYDSNENPDRQNEPMIRSWIHKLLSLATRCCATVSPNVKKGDLLDIRPYVKVKVIPGGSYRDCAYMSGVIFRKTVSHKRMARAVENPRIMLLSGGIEFTRTENRIASLETLFEQEEKYTEILVGKILKLKPDVLLVGRTVSRKAQELLLKAGVVLVRHVKSKLLSRISRQTGATVISSTDHIMNQFGASMLGKCRRFRLVTFRDNEAWTDEDLTAVDLVEKTSSDEMGADASNKGPKPATTSVKEHKQKSIKALLADPTLSNHERQAALAANRLGEGVLDGAEAVKAGLAKRGVTNTYIMLEGCPKELGCTVVLRGANRATLKQVKSVFRCLANIAYNLFLETSYLKERGARIRPDFKELPEHIYSSSLCVDYGQPPDGRKVRPWNGGNSDSSPRLEAPAELSALDHQSILITSVWMTEKAQCCPAEVKGICYYSLQDVALGQFLRDSCFNLSLKCQNPNCKKSVLDHSLSFVHNDGLINIMVEEMDEPLPSSDQSKDDDDEAASEDEDETVDRPIATWTYCQKCRKVVTPLTYISDNTWKFSFGKFLEVFFYNRDAILNAPGHGCSCNLQSSATLYFGCGKLAARFTYEKVAPFGVFVRKTLPIDTAFHRQQAMRQLDLISVESSKLFVDFDKHIEKITREARSLFNSAVNRPEHLQTVLSVLNQIGSEVDHAAKTLQEKIASISENYRDSDDGSLNGTLFQFPQFASRYLFNLTSAWNEKLSAAGQAITAMKKIASSSAHRNDGTLGPNSTSGTGDPLNEELAEGMKRLRQLIDHYARYSVTDITQVIPSLPDGNEISQDVEYDEDFDDPESSIDFTDGVDADVLASRRRLMSSRQGSNVTERSRTPSGKKPTKALGTGRSLSHDSSSSAPPKPAPGGAGAVKSALTRFFNRGGREYDRYVVNLGIFAEGRPRLPLGVDGIVIPVFDEQLSSIIAYSLSSIEYSKQFKHFSKSEGLGPTVEGTDLGDKSRKTSSPKPDLDAGVADDPARQGSDNPREKQQTPISKSASQTNISSSGGTDDLMGTERCMLNRNKSHIKHTFRDVDEKGQVICKFVCTHYWATQFHAVRQAFLSEKTGQPDSAENQDIEQNYIESLSSAYSWAASGGKSGASFSRSSDDRFVIKCISRTELQMFLDCAPAYFEYMSKAFFHGLPTVLCKIVGVYQIGVHNRETGKRSMEQVAVMQNIFYNKKITRVFDLKGSLRGRFTAHLPTVKEDERSETTNPERWPENPLSRRSSSVNPSSGSESNSIVDEAEESQKQAKKESLSGPAVLLDGDFLEFTMGRPMPLTDRAKAVFQMSILNDSLFLSIINVLDYSIVVGVDEESMELVVGIIDFMRQYDIIKQMERVGKSLPMVVGSEAPTIIQPPLYKARFTNAMERYFMTVPSKWTTI